MNWWKRTTERPNATQPQAEPAKPEYVECKKCGHIISKHSAEIVKRLVLPLGPIFLPSPWLQSRDEDLKYCKNCMPPYERIHWSENGYRYYKWIEVDENGKPIQLKRKSQ